MFMIVTYFIVPSFTYRVIVNVNFSYRVLFVRIAFYWGIILTGAEKYIGFTVLHHNPTLVNTDDGVWSCQLCHTNTATHCSIPTATVHRLARRSERSPSYWMFSNPDVQFLKRHHQLFQPSISISVIVVLDRGLVDIRYQCFMSCSGLICRDDWNQISFWLLTWHMKLLTTHNSQLTTHFTTHFTGYGLFLK